MPDQTFAQWQARTRDSLSKAPARGGVQSPISPAQALIPSPGSPGRNQHPGFAGPGNPASKYSGDRPGGQPPPWIDDVDSNGDFYSPLQPLWPFGPPQVNQPREWDYPIGYNLNYIPQRMEMMGMLRGMRASWGVLATIIATRQDQLLRIPWTIQRRDRPGQKSVAVDEMKKFFRHPDGKNSYGQWTRKLTDDLLVLDAPTIYFARDRSGRPIAAEVLDGATIFPLIDDAGRRPDSIVRVNQGGIEYLQRQPAFQQIIKGLPLVDLDESELMYVPMRPRPNLPMFGYPGTEQILVEASEAIRKTFYQLNFWAEGTIPDLIVSVPETWTPRQIAMFQAHFDALLSGNIQLKSKVRFLPGGMKPFDVKNANGESLWSQRDETLIRLACYAYSVSPTPFIKQVNRSVAQSSQSSAEEEGLYPLMSYWKDDIMDPIIQYRFGFEDIEFIFLPRPERDQEKQAKIHQIQVKGGIRNRNEVRSEIGYQPIEGGDVYTIELGNAVIPVADAAKGLAMPVQGGTGTSADGASTPSSSSSSRPPAQNSPQRGPARPIQDTPPPGLKKLSSREVDEAAQGAAGDIDGLTHAKQKAGNYPKGHIRLHGLDISIENSYASKRGKKNPDGSLKWSATMPAHYGYIRGTMGADGDQVDVYIGRRPELGKVWVIDQNRTSKKGNSKFDEHKVMLGYRTLRKALRDYRATRPNGLEGIESVTEMSVSELKTWLKDGNTTVPCSGACGKVVFRGADLSKADTISSSTGLSGRPYLRAETKKKKKSRARNAGPRWLQLSIH